MIRVDCRDIEPAMHQLAVYVADGVAAIPALKTREFALSSIGEDELDPEQIISSIKSFLAEAGREKDYAVTYSGSVVRISLVGEAEPMAPQQSSDPGLFSCPHCGYVTRFEADYNTHKVIHYL